MDIPDKTRAVVLPAYNPNFIRALLGLKTREIALPPLTPGKVAVRIEATTCNPSDIAFMQGGYNIVKPLPAVPGFEGTGVVIAATDGYKHFEGRRVAVFSQDDNSGCWAEILVTGVENCIPLKSGISLEQAAAFAINPLTAYGMFLMAVEKGSQTIVLNAAGGRVPAFIRALAARKGMEVINIFRKKNSAERIENTDNQSFLFTNDNDFEDKLIELLKTKTNVTAFDAVGGDHTGMLFNALPGNSQVVVYGGLSNKPVSGIDTLGLIFKNKTVTGFNLNDFIAKHRKDGDLQTIAEELQDLIIAGTIHTDIQAVLPLDDIVKGIRTYIKDMSAGKVIFKP